MTNADFAVYRCPVEPCDWALEETPQAMPGTPGNLDQAVRDTLAAYAAELDSKIDTHLRSHTPDELVNLLQQVAQQKSLPQMAQHIHITRTGIGGVFSIYIDQSMFPWYTVGGVRTTTAKGELPAIDITIPAEWITVDDATAEQHRG